MFRRISGWSDAAHPLICSLSAAARGHTEMRSEANGAKCAKGSLKDYVNLEKGAFYGRDYQW